MTEIEGSEFKSTHGLDFEIAEWNPIPGFPSTKEFKRFRVGTCEGLWRSTEASYDILAITNNSKGNGHLNDVFEWFENSCKRDGRCLRVLEIWNQRFKRYLIKKRGFIEHGGKDNVSKFFKVTPRSKQKKHTQSPKQ